MPSVISAGTTAGSAIAITGDTTGNLAFQTNGTTTAMTIDTSQNVGIGTSSPLQKLDVASDSASVFQTIRSTSSGATNVALRIQDGTTGTSGTDGIYLGRTGAINYLWTYENEPWVFATNNTERMRINSGGEVFVGTSTPNTVDGSRFYVYNNGDNGIVSRVDSANFCYVAQTGNGSNPGNAMSFRWTNTQVGRISTTSSATSYVTSSDYRLKENIAPMTGALSKVAQLKPCTYTWKVDGSAGQGFIAHELQEVVPDCVVGEKDAVNEDGSINAQGIDTSFLVATLTAAIQELKAELDATKAEVQALKGVA